MKNVILMDGAVGTSLWEKSTDKLPVWQYNMEKPGMVSELVDEYVRAGAQIVLANTFAANRANVKKTAYTVKDVISRAVAIAKEAAAGRAQVALSIGPQNELLEPYGDLTEDEAYEMFDEQIAPGVEAGADIIFVQTFMDIEMAKLALKAARRHDRTLFCAFSFDKNGRTMMGNNVETILKGIAPYRPDAVGLNCSLGPDLAMPVIRQFAEQTTLPLIFKPNAGKPTSADGKPGAEFDVETFVNDSLPALEAGVTYIGGCCGSNPAYIRRLSERVKELS